MAASAPLLFCKRKDDQLIEMVRLNPILYDPHHDHFRNLIMKHQIWQSISDAVDLPIVDVKKRWRHFRDHYLKKLRLHEVGLLRGKRWEYMRQLEFLAETRRRRKYEEEEHSEESDEQGAEPCAPAKKRKVSESSAPAEPAEEVSAWMESSARAEVAERTPVHKLFESMADIVCGFPPRLAAEARLRVCHLVTELELQMHAGLDSAAAPLDPHLPPVPPLPHIKRE